MPAEFSIDKYQQLYSGRTSESQYCIQCRPNGSSCIQYIINQDHFFIFYQKINLRGAWNNHIFPPAKIIPEKGDIQITQRNIAAWQQLFQLRNNPACQENSSWL